MKGFGGKYLEKKKFSKKNDINKSKNSSRLNNLEKNKFDNVNTISEFKLDNEQKDNKENIQKNQKNEYINKITEISLKLDKDILPKNNLNINNISIKFRCQRL